MTIVELELGIRLCELGKCTLTRMNSFYSLSESAPYESKVDGLGRVPIALRS